MRHASSGFKIERDIVSPFHYPFGPIGNKRVYGFLVTDSKGRLVRTPDGKIAWFKTRGQAVLFTRMMSKR